MRGSPIRNLSSISPFKASILRSERRDLIEREILERDILSRDVLAGSPDRLNSNLNEVTYWRAKTKQLQAELERVTEDLIRAAKDIERVDENQEKIAVLIAQNHHLAEENQTLLQVIRQKNSENETLRMRADTDGVVLQRQTRKAYSNINILDEEHKVHVERLLAEIGRLEDEIQEIQILKKIEIDGIRSKYESEAVQQIQNLRRSQQGNNEVLELNIRNLKDILEERNLEIERLRKEIRLEAEKATGESSFLRNEIKKIEYQKQNQLELYLAEHQNNMGNLQRTHKKNEEQMKNLYENKIRRLGYEVEEKKNQIEENLARFRRGGKEAEQEIAILLEDKAQLRREILELDAQRLQQLQEMTRFSQQETQRLRDNGEMKEDNTRTLLEEEIDRLRKIIAAKQAENSSLMNQIQTMKENQQLKLVNLNNEKEDLQNKFKEMVLHYEREIELLKIKTSKLYEADLEALKSQLDAQLSLLGSENGKLKDALQESRDHLVAELQEKVNMRRDYETRLRQMNLKWEREHQQLEDLILMAEKKFENAHSQTSIRDIEHTSKIKRQNTNIQTIFTEKRSLESQIANKSKEIEALNLRIQKMQGYHEKQLADLESRAAEEKAKYSESVNSQNELLRAQIEHQEGLEKSYKDLQEKLRMKEKEFNEKTSGKNRELDERGIRIADLEGTVSQLKKHHGLLESKVKVEVGNIERTNLQLTALMNQEKDRLERIRETDKEGIRRDFDHRGSQLKNEIADLNSLIENLRASYEAEKLRSGSLEKQLRDSLKKLDDKGILEQHVINIGLSNNYFKNIAEIFRKEL